MFLLFLSATSGFVLPNDELLTLDRRIQAAMVSDDAPFLARALADEFRFTHSDGRVQTKVDVIREAASTPRRYLRREVLNPVAEIHGNVALVLGSLDVASAANPERTQAKAICYTLNYVHLFVRRSGRWQLLSHRTTEMTKQPAPC